MTGPESATTSSPPARPFVTVSYAQTLDGRIATATGSSQWISGPESLRVAHELRAHHDALMVGIETVLHDNPRLTVRLVSGRDPLRVVADSALRTPLSAAVLANGAAAGTVLAVTDRAPAERCDAARALGAAVWHLPYDTDQRVHLAALLATLQARGVHSLMVEGGARLITSLLRERLVDRLVVCIAPKLLGPGIEAIGDLGIRDLDHALALSDTRLTPAGPDFILDGRVNYAGQLDER
jgi:5-amino-6-(5-phosphoribosylamino)uracil reductase/diaminohydroxyphosphoribosylaminopyrimidine deaminase/5-amino-6-(5-phosphoribosylamino)uracil reductase